MATILDAVTEYLRADGWKIQQVGEQAVYSMTVQGQNGSWPCIAQIFEDERLLVFYSAHPQAATADSRAGALAFLNSINYGLTFGNFELDPGDGHIRFRTSIDFTGHEPGALLIQQVIYRNVHTMDSYLKQIEVMAR